MNTDELKVRCEIELLDSDIDKILSIQRRLMEESHGVLVGFLKMSRPEQNDAYLKVEEIDREYMRYGNIINEKIQRLNVLKRVFTVLR